MGCENFFIDQFSDNIKKESLCLGILQLSIIFQDYG